MKKSFTLIEVLLAIFLFGIIAVFLFETLNFSKKSLLFFERQIDKVEKRFEFQDIIQNDILYSNEIIYTQKDKNNNTILKLESKNRLYNQSYEHLTYLITKENNLFRIESEVDYPNMKKNILSLENSYITKVLDKVEFFRVREINNTNNAHAIYIKRDNQEFIFTALPLGKID